MILFSARKTIALPAALTLTSVLTACGSESAHQGYGGQGSPGKGPGRADGAGDGARGGPTATATGPARGGPSRSATPRPGTTAAGAPATLPLAPGGRTPVFSHGPRHGGKTVALTFDADMTSGQAARAAAGERFDNPALIATLRAQKVPSTIFMTGAWARTYPRQARAMGRDPLFEIANHSYSHHAFASPCHGLPALPSGDQLRDVQKAFKAIRAAGVPNPVPYVRFPGGCYNDRVLRTLAPAGLTAVQWDVLSGDAFATSAEAVAEQVLEGVRPGSVVVLHCTRSAAPVTEQAIRRIVPELRQRGYRFVRVSELIATSLGR